MQRNRSQTWVMSSAAVLSITMLTLSSTGCGRTEVGDLIGADGDYDVEAWREVELADEEVVVVELMAPASSVSVEQLEVMPTGLVLDEVVERLMPDDTHELVIDTTTDEATLQVWVDNELRALVWL